MKLLRKLAIVPARAQSDGVILIRALLVLALMLNGAAPPPAAAMDAGHHGMDHSSDQAPADKPLGDCCDGEGCDCGCAGPHMVPLLVAVSPRAWDRAPAVPTLDGVRFSASLIVAPFRPPA